MSEEGRPTSPSSVKATANSLFRHRKRSACHSEAALYAQRDGRQTSKSRLSTSLNAQPTTAEMLTLQPDCEYAPNMLPIEHKQAVTILGLD